MNGAAVRQPSFALLLMLAWCVIAVQLLFQHWAATADALSDTDDAMRLVQMRAFLAGRSWFDLHEPRLAPPLGYESHWSRLIDAGLAGLFLFFRQFADVALAERLMRAVWPLLWLLPTIIGAAAIAWRIAGREAANVSLLLAVIALPAYQQFLPGRIDHHNVQIALSMLTVAATVWSDRRRAAAVAAGMLTGLALAIGLESLLFLVLCGAAFAVRYALDRDGADALARYGLALAGMSAAAFLVSVGPDHWRRSACDALAINWAAPIIVAGLLLAGVGRRVAGASMIVRGMAIAGAGGVASALFVALEPRCLAGPYAMMDPALHVIWLSHVAEMEPLWRVMREAPTTGVALAAFPGAAVFAALMLARHAPMRRDFAFLLCATALAGASALTMAAVKVSMYAVWLGIPIMATACLRLFARLGLKSLVARAFVAILLTPSVLSAGAIAAVQAVGSPPPEERDTRARAGCFRTQSYRPLARLAPGLVAAEIDFGPFLLAHTPHAVVAAPYHRLGEGIIAAHQIFAWPPEKAQALAARWRVTYIALCGDRPPVKLTAAERRASLWGVLRAGAVPHWLEPVAGENGEAFKVYRLR